MKKHLKKAALVVIALVMIGAPFLMSCSNSNGPEPVEIIGNGLDYMPLPQQQITWTFKIDAQRDLYYSAQASTPDKTDPVQGTGYAQIGGNSPLAIAATSAVTGFAVYAGYDAGAGINWAYNGQPFGYVELASDGAVIGKSGNSSDPIVTILPKELKKGQGWTVRSTPFENATYTVNAVELLSSYKNAENETFSNVIKVNLAVNFSKENKWMVVPQSESLAQKGNQIQVVPTELDYTALEKKTIDVNLYVAKGTGPAGGEINKCESTYTLTETKKYPGGTEVSAQIDYRREVVTGKISRIFPTQN
ncbi:MAG: hypothetical protein HGB11_01240 [Chlorobiales bacterium]|nr:hypothetical protein [Chlorobiales bacterium]